MSSKTGTMGLTKPDVNDKVADTIAALAANFDKLDAMYPIGTIYQSTKSTNPSTFLGGTWTALTGRFLVGAGTDYPAGTTGGEATHTLTIGEMPSHTHVISPTGHSSSIDTGGMSSVPVTDNSGVSALYETQSRGGGAAHNNMPPYRSVYMWERTA